MSEENKAENHKAADHKAPWHFKVLLAVLVVYLAWRGVQGLEWLVRHA